MRGAPREDRIRQIRELAAQGFIRTEVASAIGISRRQLSALCKNSGIKFVRIYKSNKRSINIEETFGCSKEQYDFLKPIGAAAAFYHKKVNARIRGIEWKLTLPEWWKIWRDSGKWERRGRRSQEYVMCRRGDVGPYSSDNVYIETAQHNQITSFEVQRARYESEQRSSDPGIYCPCDQAHNVTDQDICGYAKWRRG